MNSKFMEKAMELAVNAGEKGEIPVGAVIVRNNEIISIGVNEREKKNDALSHAEMEAITSACKKLNSWRLDDCELYVTLEPCPMCAGAIINARIRTVIFGAYDPKAGCFGSVTDLSVLPFNHKPEIFGGICEDKCTDILNRFFDELRSKNV